MSTGTPTMIYVDGFNLYYGALRATPYKWLNFEALFARVFPNNRIVGIRYDCAIVVSGDSDLATPITMARQELGKTVGVLLPQRLGNPPQRTRRRSARLQQVASFFRDGIRSGVLAASQFPATMTDTHGTFTKPVSW